jgi:hypothetical protein
MNVKLGQSLKPINQPGIISSSLSKKYSTEHYTELIENSITLRENDEIYINCIVENSKPVADIKFGLLGPSGSTSFSSNNNNNEILSLNSNNYNSFLTLAPTSHGSGSQFPNLQNMGKSSSILSLNTNVIRTSDFTSKTVLTARLKPTQEDHGKSISCKADNGFSNQKWETKKQLNVLCKCCYKF